MSAIPTLNNEQELRQRHDVLRAKQKRSGTENRELRSIRHRLNIIPEPGWREGYAIPTLNWAGAGWRDIGKTRPVNDFDFAAKLHDFAYEANGLAFDIKDAPGDPLERSRMAKADYIFRRMTDNCRLNGLVVDLGELFAERFFLGEDKSDFRQDDEYRNVLGDPRLDNPDDYLIIPFTALPRRDRWRLCRWPRRFWKFWVPTESVDYNRTLPRDRRAGGWRGWAGGRFGDWSSWTAI